MTDQSQSWDVDFPSQEALSLYKIYSDYVRSENDLINNRVGWFIQLHSFLIASYGIVVSALVQSYFPGNPPIVPPVAPQLIASMLLVGLMAIGHRSSRTARESIDAANTAILLLAAEWEGIASSPAFSLLPGLTGGGDRSAASRGIKLHETLPVTLTNLWRVSIVFPVAFVLVSCLGPHFCQGTGDARCEVYAFTR